MNKRKAIISLIAVTPLLMFANGTITGRVVNKQTGEPVDYANVQLIDAKTKKPLPIGTNTDENGAFTIKDVKDGRYLVRITNIGSIDQERPADIAGANVNIGTVKLADDTKMLDEVVVEGVRSQMRFELDRKVFQVDANVAAAGASASELLESIPSVEVDQDGEVSLRGDSSVTVWINGKESGLTADNRAQILEQIPAETIERIEVITNPSAKFSPEGSSGIINIVLKQDRKGGYFGSAEIGANSRGGGNASFSFNYSDSKWDAYASLGFRMRHNKGGSKSRRIYEMADGEEYFLNADGSSPSHGNNLFLRLGATYHLDTKNEFYFNAFGMLGHRWGWSNTLYTSNLPGQWISNLNKSSNRGDTRGSHAEIGYTHKWSQSHSIDMMVGYNHWGGPSLNTYLQEQEWADGGASTTQDDIYREQSMHLNTNSVEAKLDYTNQVLPWLKVEAGYQGNYSHENTPNSTDLGTTQADMAFAPYLYNRFIYNNDVTALYATLGGRVKNFSFSAGVRGEAWQVKTRSLGWFETDGIWYPELKDETPAYKKNFFALFPSVFLSYSLPHDNEVQINYTRRLRRPWGGQLNSFRDISDPTSISYGNPELEPTYTNSFELNYIKTWTSHMLSVSAYLRTSDNCANRISYMDNDILYTTWANVTDERNMGAEIVAKNQFFRQRLELTTTLNLYDNHISDWNYTFVSDGKEYPLSGKGNHSFAWDIRMNASVRLPWSLSFQATGRYSSRVLTAQGSRQGGWSVDAGLRKILGNWSFSLNCRDIFDSRHFKSTTNGPGYTQESERWRGGRTLSLTVKYSFGNMRAKPNKRQNGEPMEGGGYDGGDMQ
ncbi:MAG: TonB-dependent receptor [Bacteroidales bacterium]|nr:TonB-dependent receptor [Bacteroidales bacterium]